MPTKKFPFNNKNHRNNSNSKIYSGNDINSTQSNLCNKEKHYNDNNCKLTNESNNSISLYEIGLRVLEVTPVLKVFKVNLEVF